MNVIQSLRFAISRLRPATKAQPAYDADTQYLTTDGAENVSGVFKQKWVVNNYTPAEIEARKPKQLTLAEKLAAAGLTVEELKAALGL